MRTEGVFAAVSEALIPSLCPHCDQPLPGGDRGLCGGCWSAMIPRAGDSCPRCGISADDPALVCVDCVRASPPQLATVIWGEHDGVLRTAVLALKHGARDELAKPLGDRLAAAVALQTWLESVDVVCWVPSHPFRRIRNPWPAAKLLAADVARRLSRDLRPIMRRHGLHRQTGRTRTQRRGLAGTSFSATGAARDRHILLVDDVTTTGTTLRLASRALIRAGAKAVYCAVLAQTPDARRMP